MINPNKSSLNLWSAFPVLFASVAIAIPSFCLAQDDNNNRRGFDPVDFLKRLDRDGDGQLSTDEMGGRSGRFIAELGFDVSRPIVIDRVIKKIAADKEAEAANERRKGYEATRTIPGFGDEVVDLPEIPGFGLESESGPSGIASVTGNFDEETQNTIKAIMERYDEDKDGLLAGEETRRVGRWVGSVEESDLDKDGKLSPVELAEGFKKQMQRRRSGEDSQTAGDESRNGNSDRGRGRGFSRGQDRSSNSQTSSASPSTSFTPSSSSTSSRSLEGRMTEYADAMIKKYDKNGDNQLDKEERASVNVKFKDTDGDGNVSREEINEFVASAQKSSGSVSPAYVAGQRNRRDANGAGDVIANVTPGDVVMSGKTPYDPKTATSQTENGRPKGASEKFLKLDANKDGQLQMNEFSSGNEWSDELYDEFVAADVNNDGVITAEEFDR